MRMGGSRPCRPGAPRLEGPARPTAPMAAPRRATGGCSRSSSCSRRRATPPSRPRAAQDRPRRGRRGHQGRVQGRQGGPARARHEGAVARRGRHNDADLPSCAPTALGDDTINDDERMFLAGLLDAANASALASRAAGRRHEAHVHARLRSRPTIAHARDIDQATKDPTIAGESAAAADGDAGRRPVGLVPAREHRRPDDLSPRRSRSSGAAWQQKTSTRSGTRSARSRRTRTSSRR